MHPHSHNLFIHKWKHTNRDAQKSQTHTLHADTCRGSKQWLPTPVVTFCCHQWEGKGYRTHTHTRTSGFFFSSSSQFDTVAILHQNKFGISRPAQTQTEASCGLDLQEAGLVCTVCGWFLNLLPSNKTTWSKSHPEWHLCVSVVVAVFLYFSSSLFFIHLKVKKQEVKT